MLAFNTSTNQATNCTPYYALFGTCARLELDLIVGKPKEDESSDPSTYGAKLSSRLSQTYNYMRVNEKLHIERREKYYHETDAKYYVVGAKVWLFTPRLQKNVSPKMQSGWTGAWIIIKKVSAVLFTIKALEWSVTELIVTASLDRLKLYKGSWSPNNREILPQQYDKDQFKTTLDFDNELLGDNDEDDGGLQTPELSQHFEELERFRLPSGAWYTRKKK